MLHDEMVLGAILIHCTGQTASFTDSLRDKVSCKLLNKRYLFRYLVNWKLNTTGMNPSTESFLILHRFGWVKMKFSFSGQCYQQLKGSPMRSPISGFLAEAVMQKLESIAHPDVKPKLWLRYNDDAFVIVKKELFDLLHKNLNSAFPGIKFTSETEADGQLPFPDVLVHRKIDGSLHTSVVRKQAFSEIILHFESNHPIFRKRSFVYSLLNRAKTYCSDEETYRAEIKYLFNVFSKNGYPRDFAH
ncbi:unnamed protein product [Schistocephalus solidus]|uniref:Reverse transcriptase domain-containing protein n=1 Tax=Schistocephalus solidus TaxID=70667 RepID=A0A183SJJ5_SCHSO|nr:unnamed protein product [Schistocephalus solidus]